MDWAEKLVIPIIVALIPTLITFWLDSKRKKENKESNREIRAEIKMLLKEQEIRIRTEEELKQCKQISDLFKEERKEYKKQTEELENINNQLKYLLSWYKFDKRDPELIIDDNIQIHDWLEKPEIQKIRKEIANKKFKCEDYLESLEKDK